MESLPLFRYHPDPLNSGSVIPSDEVCECCGRRRGFLYAGPVYLEDDLDDGICPWCIGDGSANGKYGVTFVDPEAFPDEIPIPVTEEVRERTPGFHTWQSERWPSCCGDATAFLMPAGIKEIRDSYPEVEDCVLGYIGRELGVTGAAARRMLAALHREIGPTAYIFRCLQCGQLHSHVDQP